MDLLKISVRLFFFFVVLRTNLSLPSWCSNVASVLDNIMVATNLVKDITVALYHKSGGRIHNHPFALSTLDFRNTSGQGGKRTAPKKSGTRWMLE